MTAFSILGASGLAYHRGIGVFGMLASASAFVIPLSIFFIGTRLWALGKKFGHMTQVQFLRDRWECSFVGTLIFALTAVMLVPYIIIGVMGGGQTLQAISGGKVPYWAGGAIVALVVMSYVFFGGMRGTAWVNTFQTLMFLCFGWMAFVLIGKHLGGFDQVMQRLAENPATATLLTRQRIPMAEFFSYAFIPLSSIMFPHVAIMCMTAKKASSFKTTVELSGNVRDAGRRIIAVAAMDGDPIAGASAVRRGPRAKDPTSTTASTAPPAAIRRVRLRFTLNAISRRSWPSACSRRTHASS